MARIPAGIIVLLVTVLVLTFSPTTNSFSLDDRLQQTEDYIDNKIKGLAARLETLTDNYAEMKKELLAEKVARLEVETKWKELESKVIRLEEIIALQNKKPISSAELTSSHLGLYDRPLGKNVMFPRTCREVRSSDPSLSSGMYWIDPDGQGVGDNPISVYCDMTLGSTSILHDSELRTDVGHCADPGCYSRPINYYNATMRQMIALADLSAECHQSIRVDCNFAPFEVGGVTSYSWWNDRNGTAQYFWSGDNSSVHTCQCGIDHNCVDPSLLCNCDAAAPVPLTDSGVITEKSFLPITRLNFGRTQLVSSSRNYTLGRMECTGQVAVNEMPKSCADLWRIGHSLSGLYSVMGTNQVESVYCDYSKLHTESGFEKRIGYVDVKSSPAYFYVQRDSDFSTLNVPIPFTVERLNIGGAMNLESGIFTAPRPGVYFFSHFGLVNGDALRVVLYVNGNHIGSGYGASGGDTFTLQSTLHLNTGDQISVRISTGILHSTGMLYTHFTGWLLQEDM